MNNSLNQKLIRLVAMRKSRGLSLIELMVSMAITLILLLAIVNVYVASKETYRVREDFSKLQELGRQTLEVLTGSIIMADHWGGNPYGDVSVGSTTVTAGSGTCDAAWIQNVSQPIIGVDGASTTSGLGAGVFASCVPNSEYVPNTDVLVVRYSEGEIHTDAEVDATNSKGLFIRSEVESRGVLFSGGTSGAATGTGVGTSSTLDATRNYPYKIEAFFVRNCSDTPCSDGIPTLSRLTMNEDKLEVEPLADGIEQIQYQYGIDTDADAVADQFINAGSVANWDQVVAIRVDMIIRSATQDHSVSDTTTYNLAGGSGVTGGLNFTPSSTTQAFHRKQLTKIIHIRNRVRS